MHTVRQHADGRAEQPLYREPVEEYREAVEDQATETAEELIRQSQRLFRLIARNLPGGAISVVDRDLRYVAADGPVLARLGLSRETMEGRLVTEAVSEPPRSLIEQRFRRALSGVTGSHETAFPDRTVWSQYVPLRDEHDRIVGAMNLALDVTERKAAERALRERETELRLIIDSQPALISYIDNNYRYRRVNAAYERWFSMPAGEIQGHLVSEVLGDEAWQAVRPYMERALAGESVTYERELPYKGGPRWVQVTYRPDRDETDGTIRGFVVLVLDIAERKRVEHALQEADRRKNEFLATLSHELRNPLAPIRYALDLLRRETPEGTERPLQVIDRHLRHLVHLVDELLDATRIATGKIRLKRTRVNLAAVVEQAVEATFPEIEEAGQHLTVTLPEERVWLYADGSRLAQVITNLVTNATRHTPRDGRVAIAVVPEASGVRITVSDTGVGLSQEDAERVFEMFTQLGEPARGGLGIGLALVKEIVGLHGGKVEARSEGRGHGAEFTIWLPFTDAPEGTTHQADATRAAHARSLSGPRRILVVDDNADAAEMMQHLLRHRGHDVRTAQSGRAAMEIAREFKPDVGLFDIGLPDMDGYELVKLVREDPVIRGMFLIAVTGWGQIEDRQRSLESGFQAHVTKPAEPEEIERLIAEAGVSPLQ